MKNFQVSENKKESIHSGSTILKITNWVDDLNMPFMVGSASMIIMLLWAGSYKMTGPGAEGIIPLVSNSPLISWHFKLFGPYLGSDIIGMTEIMAAVLMIIGYFRPKAGIIGVFITLVMFITTGSMVITTPDTITLVKGVGYMSFLGLFLFKDIVSLGLSLFLLSSYRKKALSKF
jgi:uncharacterized membrane protein YkgB